MMLFWVLKSFQILFQNQEQAVVWYEKQKIWVFQSFLKTNWIFYFGIGEAHSLVPNIVEVKYIIFYQSLTKTYYLWNVVYMWGKSIGVRVFQKFAS